MMDLQIFQLVESTIAFLTCGQFNLVLALASYLKCVHLAPFSQIEQKQTSNAPRQVANNFVLLLNVLAFPQSINTE